MSSEELWDVQAEDGHTFQLRARPPAGAPRAAWLFFPAMGVKAAYYAQFADALREAGVLLVVAELRGIDTSSVRPSRRVDFGYRHIAELDVPAALEVVREKAPGVPLYLGGHSLGGQLALLHAAVAGPDVAGILLVACASPYRALYSGRERKLVEFAARFFPVVGAVMGYVPGKKLGFGGTEARTLMRDWAFNARTGRYAPTGTEHDYEAALAGFSLPLFTVNIEGDEMGPPQAVDFIREKVPNAPSQRAEATLAEHKPGTHVRWVRDSGNVVARITEWLPN